MTVFATVRVKSGLNGSSLEPIFNYLIKTYYKLNELGITETNGKIVFVDKMGEKS